MNVVEAAVRPSRTTATTRPATGTPASAGTTLHEEADLKRILESREPLYRKADVTIDTAGEDPRQSLSKLRQAVLA